MASKYQRITALYESAILQVTASPGEWTAFMRSACRNYKCRFDELILIYAQRPDAVAVLEIEKWNKPFGRWVNRGATGIAVFDDEHNGGYRLKHYFDIGDTHETRFSTAVPIWTMRQRYETDVIETLENSFGELRDKSDLANALMSAANNAVDDNITDYLAELLDFREYSALADMDEDSVSAEYRAAIRNSVAYMLMTRCGIDADRYFGAEVFRSVTSFNTPQTINALGIATGDIAKMCLREIAAVALNLQNRENNLNRTFAYNQNLDYNEPTKQQQRSINNYGTDIQNVGRVQSTEPDRTGGNRNSPWQVRATPKEIPEREPENPVRESADGGQTDRTPYGNRANGDGAVGADNLADSGGAGSDGGLESQRPDEVGGNDEQYPTLGGGNDTGRTDIHLKQLPTVTQQMAIFGEPESEQLSGFSISQHIIDEVLTSGGNELDSPLRIAAYFEKDHTLTENAEFLKSEYHTGGKGFIFGGNRVSIWFDDSGIRIAVGDTVLGGNATLVSWEQAATRIRELLDLGRYMPQSELDKVRGTELKAVADNLWYLRREVEDTYAFLDNELFSGGFPDDTERIAEVLTNPDNLQNIIDAIEKIAAAYEQNNDILRFQSSARLMRTALSGLSDLQRELIVFTADESVSSARPGFITQDEADAVLLRGGDIQHGKFRIYAYFLQEHTAQEKAKFLREEYGIGGFGRTGFDEWHDGQGIAYSRENNHMPYDKVILPWNKVARRIDELIADGRYLTRRELDYIPEYEKDELSRDVYSFYPRQPEELPRPFPHSTDFLDGVKIIREQLDSPERVTDILNSMAAILDNIGGESPQTKERMAEAYRNLTAFQNGTFTLFPTLAPEHRPAEKEYAQIVAPTIVAPVVVNETAEYELQLGATVYIGAEKFEIYAVDDSIVTLTDADAPLFIRDMNRSEFDRKLRENPRNDTLIKKTIAPEIDYELVERIREEMSERGFAVSDELIISGINEYSPYGDYQDISDNIENEYLSDEPQPGYEEWSEPATADNAPETPGVPSDDISAYLPNPDDVRSTVIAELNRKVDLMRNSTDYDKIRESVAYLTSWRDISNFDGVSADVLREQLAAMTDAQAVEWFSDGDWREQLDFVVISDAPAWEQTKRQPRTRTYDAFPGVPMSERNNFRITDDNLGVGVAKEKFRRNVAAIRLLKELELNNRLANSEEQDTLSKYVGWGALSAAFEPNNNSWSDKFDELQDLLSPEEFESARTTTLNAHYTSPVVIKAIYKAIENMGFKSGNILDPGCGIGNFQGLLPDSMNGSQIFGIEIDSLTGRIAQQLYQKNRVTIQGYEKTSLPDSFFDMAIGNVPFGGYGIADKKYDKYKFRIHDYFFAKTLDKIRPGGVIAFITSKGTLDKQNSAVRKYLAQRAELLGAIRLPNTAFKANAGTEVTTDIIFLQKRDRAIDAEPDWIHLGKTDNDIPINSYYIEHPEMMLGTMSIEDGSRMYAGANSASCIPFPDSDLAAQLDEAIQNIHAEITELEQDELDEQEDNSIAADPTIRNFSYTIVEGIIYFRENSRMYPQEIPVTAQSRVKGMVEMRNCVRKLIEYQTEDYPDEDIKTEQARLNRLYDTFTRKYGLLNDRANRLAFSDDESYLLLCSLEILDKENKLKAKADMFTKRTIRAFEPVTRVDTAAEALVVSIGEKGCVDLGFMASLLGNRITNDNSLPDIVRDLQGVIFKDPASGKISIGNPDWYNVGWKNADDYLSGNVREKLAAAREAESANPGAFTINVTALEAVQPKDLNAGEISVRLGATWLSTDVIQQFVFELLEPSWREQSRIKVLYSDYTAEWNISGKSEDRDNIRSFNTYGTKRASAYWIIEQSLNLRTVRIFDKEYEDGKEKLILNEDETAIAQDKQDLIKSKFSEWLWKDPARRERLCGIYNNIFNSIRPRNYDGQHIRFSGMNPEITLDKHQVNAVARHIYGGNALFGHAVGAGKSFEMIAAAMEAKRLGLSSKAMFVVPKNILGDFSSDFFRLYPSANVLMATKKDFEKRNRKKFCARISTGDYDGVIIAHSQFEKVPMSIERQRLSLERQMNDIEMGIAEVKEEKGERFTIKQMEKSHKLLEVKLERLNDQSRKDSLVTFEDLGIDLLFVDEADLFKNLYLVTKMRNVSGVQQTEAQKASDLFMKTRYLDERTHNRGVVFATGTPISNSLSEMFTMQRYLQYDALVNRGLEHFDKWASTFGETVTAMELAPEGSGYRMKTRFSSFYNLPELMNLFREVADIQTKDMLKLPTPKVNYQTIVSKPSDMQTEMIKGLAERAEKIRSRIVDQSEDNMLLITNDGRKIALDQRIVNPMLPDFEGSKVNACADNVYRIWNETKDKRLTQIIFCDLSTPKGKDKPIEMTEVDGEFVVDENHFSDVYDDIRAKLIAKGIPRNEIAFIHEAKNEMQRTDMFAKVRVGAIRVILGSTSMMGAGTNIQNLLIATHDLDVPWRPRDLEQRGGRVERRGNDNPEVYIYRYVTESTFVLY